MDTTPPNKPKESAVDSVLGFIGCLIFVPLILYGLWCGAAFIVSMFVKTVRSY